MNDVLAAFAYLICVFLWKGVTSCSCPQRCLHALGCLAWLVQWYTLLFLGLGLLLARTFWDIVRFEYVKYNFLDSPRLVNDTQHIKGLTLEDKEDMRIPPHLRIASLVAPVAGVLAASIVTEHVWKLVRAQKERQSQQGKSAVWWMSYEMNLVLLVIAMPIVFILMAMRAEVRIWEVMTGSAWEPCLVDATQAQCDWKILKTLDMSMYTSDLELAGFFQYFTIWNFGVLCMHYMQNAPREYRFALKWAGLQGVYLYVIFGVVRSLGNMAANVVANVPAFVQYEKLAAVWQDKALSMITPVFNVATLLCVYNMIIVSKMSDVKEKLDNANLKFQATRFLVLVAQLQLQVLMGVTVGSKLYNLLEGHLPPHAQEMIGLSMWNLSPDRAKLMHATLLNFECLAVAIVNRIAWPSTRDYSGSAGSSRQAQAAERRGAAGSLVQRLLDLEA